MTTLTYSARAAKATATTAAAAVAPAAIAVATTLTVTGNAKSLTADQLLLGFQYCQLVNIVCYKTASQKESAHKKKNTDTHT